MTEEPREGRLSRFSGLLRGRGRAIKHELGYLEFQVAARTLEPSLCDLCVNLITIFNHAANHLTFRENFYKTSVISKAPGLGLKQLLSSDLLLSTNCRLCLRIERFKFYDLSISDDGMLLNGHVERLGYKGHVGDVNQCRVYTEYGDLTESKVLGRPVRHHGGDLRTLKLARSWVDDCVNNHPECRSPERQGKILPKLPTRVIDVGISPGDSPRLLCPKNQRGAWTALSHCWGKESFLTATESNVDALKTQIDISSLPLTFRDAITVTKQLGVRYLWIDSLCIIQDSPKDWQAEAACMPDIYRNAHAVVAAAATYSSQNGFLGNRKWVPASTACEIHIPFGEKIGKVTFDDNFFNENDRDKNNTLLHRAWCFQEINLSHRLITFDQLQMTFTCLRHGLFESRDSEDPIRRDERNLFLERFQGPLTANNDRRAGQLLSIWYGLLADYTKRSLTCPSDKLVALSGISKVVGHCFQSDYYAGLWQRFMPQVLLWSPYDEETLPNPPHRATRPLAYRAPSWSWASIEGPISGFICRESFARKPLAEVLEIQTTLVGPDTYGQVSGGYMLIRAPMWRASCGIRLDEWPCQPGIVWPEEAGCVAGDKSHCVFDVEAVEVGAEIWCLQVTEVYGLILERNSKGENEYCRRGVFHLRTTRGEGSYGKHFSREAEVRGVRVV